MSDERRNALVEAGRVAMARYLDAQANPVALSKGPHSKPAGQARTMADRIATSLLFGERDRRPSDLLEAEAFPARTAPVESSNGEGLRTPSDFNPPTLTKLPMTVAMPLGPAARPGLPQEISQEVPEEIRNAWTQYMANGFKQNETMFKRTLEAFMKPYRLTIWLYGILFAVGIGLFLTAVVIGLRNGSPVVSIAFAGLSVGAFLAFFLRQPLHALEENLEFITWLGVAFNTYWTRLMYMTDSKTVQADLKAAESDFRESVERLITQHAELRGKRPGAN
jgi:hypothetical protein